MKSVCHIGGELTLAIFMHHNDAMVEGVGGVLLSRGRPFEFFCRHIRAVSLIGE